MPQILLRRSKFLSTVYAIIFSPKMLSFCNNWGDITKILFSDKATHKKSQGPWSTQPVNWKPCRWLVRSSMHSDVTIVQHLAGFFELI